MREPQQGDVMNEINASQYVCADLYRCGQHDGFKAGLAVGVIGLVLLKTAVKNHKRRHINWFGKTEK